MFFFSIPTATIFPKLVDIEHNTETVSSTGFSDAVAGGGLLPGGLQSPALDLHPGSPSSAANELYSPSKLQFFAENKRSRRSTET